MDPHIFADPDPDPDPGSQNLADPTDPDPKHWWYGYESGPGVLSKLVNRRSRMERSANLFGCIV